jgi:hypothetical protein
MGPILFVSSHDLRRYLLLGAYLLISLASDRPVLAGNDYACVDNWYLDGPCSSSDDECMLFPCLAWRQNLNHNAIAMGNKTTRGWTSKREVQDCYEYVHCELVIGEGGFLSCIPVPPVWVVRSEIWVVKPCEIGIAMLWRGIPAGIDQL